MDFAVSVVAGGLDVVLVADLVVYAVVLADSVFADALAVGLVDGAYAVFVADLDDVRTGWLPIRTVQNLKVLRLRSVFSYAVPFKESYKKR